MAIERETIEIVLVETTGIKDLSNLRIKGTTRVRNREKNINPNTMIPQYVTDMVKSTPTSV